MEIVIDYLLLPNVSFAERFKAVINNLTNLEVTEITSEINAQMNVNTLRAHIE